jgi:hypothetical protein
MNVENKEDDEVKNQNGTTVSEARITECGAGGGI